MSRKDYELLAACFRNAPRGTTPEYDRRSVVEAIALELKLDNPRFDSDRFMAACLSEEA